ncbi:MAG: hypothetical protein KF753_11340 [Caldilineaceae bacterium]|nr:hypothetical protein [Caldilineaceae bacterium]
MTRNDGRLLWGGLLVFLGFAFLLQNLGVLDIFGIIPENLWTIFWIGAFGCAGLLFLGGLWLNRQNWWMAIPGFILLGLSATILVDEFIPGFPFSGSIFLGSIGVAFLAVYLMNREHWWAIIPGGVNGTLAVVAGLDEVNGWDNGGIFFLGLAVTFALVALAPATARGKMTWAWIPAGVLLALAVITTASLEGFIGILWPLVLVGLGGALLYRNYLRSHNE